MSPSRRLLDLQSVDSDLDARNARLAEIEAALGDDAELVPLRKRTAATVKLAEQIAGRQRQLDTAISDLTEHIEDVEAKLYSGSVTSSRELTDLQADIDQLKRRRGEQEDLLLGVLEELDQATEARDRRTKRLARMEREWEAAQSSMTTEREQLTGEVAELTSQRDGHASAIAAPELALYDRIRKSHAGIGVALMRNATCEACRVSLPNRVAGDVRTSTAPVTCPSCGRILLAD